MSTVLVHEELEKHQRLKEELEKMWGLKTILVPMVTGATISRDNKLDKFDTFGWIKKWINKQIWSVFIFSLASP